MVQERPVRVERRLSAILAADVAGYSRLMHNDEEATHTKLAAILADAVNPAIAEHGGRVVKNTGDGFLADFPSAVQAVRAAVQFQTRIKELTTTQAEDGRIAFRVGLNVGDVIVEPHDIFGDVVNIAARLESIAEPGGICISSSAYDHIQGKVAVEFADLGEQNLKNIARPVRAYAVIRDGRSPAILADGIKPGQLSPPRLSIVVLPFANLSGDPEQDYFVDGVTESLTMDLSRIGGSLVIARNSAFSYKGKSIDVRQVGRELNVRYVLEGSVQRGGNRLRVNVQLVNAETGHHLWADRFDKPVADLFDMQDEIVSRIANSLNTQLIKAEARRTERSTLDRLAHEYGLKDELDGAWAVRPLELICEGGRTMLVLEDLGGEPLDRLLGAPMEVGRFLRLAIGIAAALGKLHQRGLVHKDIKPANILVNGATGAVKFTGFGIASRLARERQAPEPPETIAGTLAYMAPEQTGRMNRSVDSRSDLYALGVTLYELLTGALPFTAADPFDLIHCHIAREPVPPGELAGMVPAVLSMIIMKLLAKTAEARYQTAAGVEADLRKCLTAWKSIGRIDPFPLGLQDASERLMIPEKLYGREGEIATLLAAFDRVVMHGGSELVLVSGYSGIGKSSVVNELHKVIVLPRGIFISGKFDQRLRDTPHSTLAQAFQGLIQQLLNGQADDIARWRDAIKEAVGNQGRLLTDLIPDLARLIGPQPTVAVLSPVDAELRFQTVFQRFVGVFARAEHPLVIFVDDLQWLDPATLTLIEYLLLHPDTRHLLVIGAYRDNEVDSAHPLVLKLEALRRAGAKVDQIVLSPLSVDDINQLLCDTLRHAPDEMRPFAELVHRRSGGNPFFAGQFLTSLAEEGLVEFDPRSRSWTWDLDAIVDKRFSDNPVDLMIGRLRRLAPEAQEALKLLACLGNHADFATLAKLRGESDEAMHAGFRDAVRAGAVLPREGSYRFFHDRVQEAAYALIPPEGRAELHLRIARLLVAETVPERIAEKIFDLVNQLNLGSALISEWPEKVRAAELNFVAGRKAKASTAYASASNYLAAGIAILSDEGWQRSYGLTLGLFLERAECEILSSNLEEATGLVEELLIKAQSKIDQAEICRLRMFLQLRQGNYAHAVCTALECLRTFGVDLPDSPTPERVRAEYEEMRRTLGDRPIESLVDLPMMDDPEMRAVMKLFSALGQLAYHADGDLYQMISCWMVKLSCRHGTSEYSTIGYGAIALVLGPVFHRFADGEAFARLAVAVAERYGFSAQKAGAHFLMQMAVLWTRPIEDALNCLEAAIRSVGETGEMVYACFNRQHRVTDLMARGDPLDQVWIESASALDFVRKYKFGQLVILSIQGFVQSLRGGAGSGAPLDEAALEARVLRGGVPLVACFHWILQLQRHVLLGNAERALEFAAKAKPILWSARLNLQSIDYCFYHSLAIAAVFEAASPERRAELREELIEHLASFQRWAESCPATFAHKHALVSAEWAYLEGRDIEAMRLYEHAICSAAERGFLQDQALASELAARFYRLRGLEKVADTYLDEARDCYARWGAWAKVAQLDQRQPRVRQQPPSAPTRPRR
jgi:predicted ATPase/TolB-like protein/class 3 adenylate cyclase